MSVKLNFSAMINTLFELKGNQLTKWEHLFLVDMIEKYGNTGTWERLSPKEESKIREIHKYYMTYN